MTMTVPVVRARTLAVEEVGTERCLGKQSGEQQVPGFGVRHGAGLAVSEVLVLKDLLPAFTREAKRSML